MGNARRLVLGSLIAMVLSSHARAGLTVISNPGDAYPGGGTWVSQTTLMDITGDQFDTLTSLSKSPLTVDFSESMMILDVPDGWATWSLPPFSESDTPRVLWTQGPTQVTLTFSRLLTAFGFELQPNPFGPFTFTAEYFDENGSLIDSITRDVGGDSGARLFAGVVDGSDPGIASIRISSQGADFAIAQLRFVPSSVQVVPEPSSCVLALTGVAAMFYVTRRRLA